MSRITEIEVVFLLVFFGLSPCLAAVYSAAVDGFLEPQQQADCHSDLSFHSPSYHRQSVFPFICIYQSINKNHQTKIKYFNVII